MKQPHGVRRAQSCKTDAREAVREFHAAVAQPNMALVMFFCASTYDLAALAEEMNAVFVGVQVVGCTTAGEFGPIGFHDHSLTGVSFPADSFNAVTACIEHLQRFEAAAGQAIVQQLLQRLTGDAPQAKPDNSFAFLLTDGLSVREESLTRALQSALGRLPLVGGSAGDGINFKRTHIYFEGRFRTDSAVLILLSSRLPFKLFMTQHFVATDQRLVVTAADAARRIVWEINGLPAAREYARMLGVDLGDLGPRHFAASPVVVLINGMNYVRAIQKANPDGSLTFFCAIENGLVLRLAKGIDLLVSLEQTFSQIRAEIGPPQLVLGCNCILRKQEIDQSGISERIEALLRQNCTTGFNTYGEQFRGVHVNQTFVGIAIGTDATETQDA